MKFPNAKIIQFAKAPEAGKVKTRLIPALGEQGALALHKRLIRKVFAELTKAKLCQIELWVSGYRVAPFFNKLIENTKACPIHLQTEGDLGQRMQHALEQVLTNCSYALIVGSDCPAVTQDYLEQALVALEQGADVVIGPAEDGGYVLIGMRRVYSKLFNDIDWGSDRVFAQTEEKLKSIACTWIKLPELWDVDRPEDLKKLSMLKH